MDGVLSAGTLVLVDHACVEDGANAITEEHRAGWPGSRIGGHQTTTWRLYPMRTMSIQAGNRPISGQLTNQVRDVCDQCMRPRTLLDFTGYVARATLNLEITGLRSEDR